MDNRQKIVLGILVVSVFIFLITVLVFVYALAAQGIEVPSFLIPFMEYHVHFMVLMGIFGVASGLVVYKILSYTIQKEKKTVQTNLGIIMKFLGKEDRELVSLLLSKDGMTTQSEISKLPGMTRLKAHRVVKKLEDRGVVHVEKNGKINMVRLVEELKDASK